MVLHRGGTRSDRGRGADVMGGFHEGQLSGVYTTGREPERGASYPGHRREVTQRSTRHETEQLICLSTEFDLRKL